MTYRRTISFWLAVRAQLAIHTRHWNNGTQGRLLFENLCQHEDRLQRLRELAPKSRKLSPASVAAAVLTKYFSQALT